jgi:NDP-sugar pyrophosphorylase family protein
MTPIVLVLAGGASNRFWPLTDKPLVEFGELTLLERHLGAVREAGADRILIVCRPETEGRARQIASRSGGTVRIALQPEARGMADAILKARDHLATFGDASLYVTQAQDVVDPGLHKRMLNSDLGPDFALLAAARVNSYFPGGYLTVANGRITSVVEKPGAGREPSDLVNVVAHLFSSWQPLVEQLELEMGRPGPDDAYERALAALMPERVFRPAIYEDRWEALKYPWQVLDVMAMLLDRWASGSESPGDGYTLREDGVVVGTNVRVFPGAHVVAPAFLGNDVVVGHNALVRGSLISAKSVVGFGSEVARSYLGPGVELHHNYVGDSVLGAGSSMGFGGTTANFRLDGRTVPSIVSGERLDSGREKLGLITGAAVKIGVNTSTMPGIKIGAAAIIGPNLVINRDVPDAARVLTDDEYRRF